MPFIRWLGKSFGFLMWVFSRRYRKHFEDNWLQAKKADEKGRMEKCSILKAVGNSGEIFFETTKIWTQSNIISLVETKGIDWAMLKCSTDFSVLEWIGKKVSF